MYVLLCHSALDTDAETAVRNLDGTEVGGRKIKVAVALPAGTGAAPRQKAPARRPPRPAPARPGSAAAATGAGTSASAGASAGARGQAVRPPRRPRPTRPRRTGGDDNGLPKGPTRDFEHCIVVWGLSPDTVTPARLKKR